MRGWWLRLRACVASRRFWRVLAILALVSLILAGVGLVGLEIWANSHYKAAEKALAREDFDLAQKHLAKALLGKPRSSLVHLLAGRVARRTGDFSRAQYHLDRCFKLQGNRVSEDLQLEQLMLKAQTGEVETVADQLFVYVEQDRPEAPLILEALALGYAREHLLGPASKCAELWVAREPDNPQARYLLGFSLSSQGLFRPAVTNLRRAAELVPERDDIRQQLAHALSGAQFYQEARREFQRVLDRHPDDPQAKFGVAGCWAALGEAQKAQKLLDELLQHDPRCVEFLIERGKLFLENDQPKAAEADLRRALAINPNEVQAAYQYMLCLRKLGKKEEADKWSVKVRRMEADVERIQKLLRKELHRPDRRPDDCYQAATLLIQYGRKSDALYWLYQALKTDPNYLPAHKLLAEHWEKVGDKERAARHRAALQQ